MATMQASYRTDGGAPPEARAATSGSDLAVGDDEAELGDGGARFGGPREVLGNVPTQRRASQAPQARLAAKHLGLGRWGMGELVIVLRWLALGVSVVSAALAKPVRGELLADVGGAATLAVVAVARTLWPVRVAGEGTGAPIAPKRCLAGRAGLSLATKRAGGVLVELALVAGVVGVTGVVNSPFLVSFATACFVAGLILPPSLLGASAVFVIGGLAAAGVAGAEPKPAAARAVEGVAVVAALALLGSYSEWLARKARQARDSEVARLKDLAEVNQLLLDLHAKASSLPAALSLKVAVSNLANRLRQLLQPDVVVLLLASPVSESAGQHWEVTLAEGVGLPRAIDGGSLAPALRESANSLVPLCREGLSCGEGVAPGSWTGLYVPMWARDRLIGLLAVERVGPGAPFGEEELEMVEGLSRHAGLAIDNARWFRRLRALGAEEERSRLARELHDRVGQSLAYLAICLERLQSEVASGAVRAASDLSAELGELALEARRAVCEVRTKLCDLRTDVVGEHGMAAAIEGLLQRTEVRSGMTAALCLGDVAPLEPATAREVVRIAEEAVNNAERHSGGTRVEVRLSWDGRTGMLLVADNGKGLPAKAPLRPDAFGILGMRERAEAIGGLLSIRSRAARGTSVLLRWGEGAPASVRRHK